MSAVNIPDHSRDTREPPFGFWRRSFAMVVKEFIQLRRDRVSFAMIVMIPVMQLLLFGFAINTTPRNLPTAVLLQEDSDLARSILKALENTAYFHFTREVHDVAEFDNLLLSGKVLFGVEIPRGFERAVRRGDHPALLVAADATDPVAAGSALGALGVVVPGVCCGVCCGVGAGVGCGVCDVAMPAIELSSSSDELLRRSKRLVLIDILTPTIAIR